MEDTGKKEKKPILKSELFWFLIFTFAVSCGTIWKMERANTSMRISHELIVKNNKDIQTQLKDSILSLYKTALSDSTLTARQRDSYAESIDKTVANFIDRDYDERAKDLMEIEFSKIQNEYEVLNLWCALLTVVFLIFSFFSIFKTNEMSRQGEEALVSLRATAKEAKKKSDNIEQQVSAAEQRITEKEKDLISGLTKKVQSLTDQLTTNETTLEQLKADVQTQSGIMQELSDKRDETFSDIDQKVSGVEETLFKRIEEAVKAQASLKMKDLSDSITELRDDHGNLRDTVLRLMSQIKVNDTEGKDYEVSEEEDDIDSHEEEPEEDMTLTEESSEVLE